MRRAHFIVVEGEPQLAGVPTFEVESINLAVEGMRAYDEWRNAPSASGGRATSAPPSSMRTPKPVERDVTAEPLKSDSAEAAFDAILGD